MNCATKSRQTQILVWFIWAIACMVFFLLPEWVVSSPSIQMDVPALPGVATNGKGNQFLFPWQPKHRVRKWAWRQYCKLRRAHRRAVRVARLARLCLVGTLNMAGVVDLLTQSQLRRHLGALPMLYRLLEVMKVRQIVNRYCPTASPVDHGTVAMVLLLNRLTAPRPLYQIADWAAKTVLVSMLDIPASKFNDDRLGRTLDAISKHTRDIWQGIVHHALIHFDIDLSIIFYDLTAFVMHGAYSESKHVKFGFAHNTPLDKRKVKEGLNVSADGNIPAAYELWAGNTADLATVQENMKHLCQLLRRHGCQIDETIIIGDRANLNDELAVVYEEYGLHYLSGLQARKKVHRALLEKYPTQQFYAHPLSKGYWGICRPIVFEYEKRQVTHRGLIVLSGPMRAAHRQSRAQHLWELNRALWQVRANIGEPYYRTVRSVQRRADTQLRRNRAGKFMRAEAYADQEGQVHLRWWLDQYALWQADQRDGRYLLVTNDWSLSPERMLALYRQKDSVEKRFKVSKSDLKVSPIYLHKDKRIEAMLLINMLALLTYSLLERQVRQNGMHITTRHIIQKLESLDVIETYCWDGSRLCRLVPIDDEQAMLLSVLQQILGGLVFPCYNRPSLATGGQVPLALCMEGWKDTD